MWSWLFWKYKVQILKKLAIKASNRIGCLLRNVLIVGKGEDQACVLFHVEQKVVQVEHQQLDALLAETGGSV